MERQKRAAKNSTVKFRQHTRNEISQTVLCTRVDACAFKVMACGAGDDARGPTGEEGPEAIEPGVSSRQLLDYPMFLNRVHLLNSLR